MSIALFPGSFDPPTIGHINIIERAAALFDKLHVVVADNISKKYLFTPEERINLIKASIPDADNIVYAIHSGLTVDYARDNSIPIMIRGVRGAGDFSYELEMAMTNKQLYPELEVLFMPTDPRYFLIRASQIKELAAFGADFSSMVTPPVYKALEEKYDIINNNCR